MSSRRNVLNTSVLKGAKKKVSNSKKWKENVAKARKQSGQEYLSKSTEQAMPGKSYIYNQNMLQ